MISGLVIEEDNVVLYVPVTKMEIEEMIKSMMLGKAPGPDRLPADFYQRCWEIISADVTATIEFFNTSKMPYS